MNIFTLFCLESNNDTYCAKNVIFIHEFSKHLPTGGRGPTPSHIQSLRSIALTPFLKSWLRHWCEYHDLSSHVTMNYDLYSGVIGLYIPYVTSRMTTIVVKKKYPLILYFVTDQTICGHKNGNRTQVYFVSISSINFQLSVGLSLL